MLSPRLAAPAALLLALSGTAVTEPARSPFAPVAGKSHTETVRSSRKAYEIAVGGTVDMTTTTTRRYETFEIAFQNNVSLTIANTGRVTVKNPRVISNGKRRWWCIEEMLREILDGARNDREKARRIYEFVRHNRHHDDPIFTGDELHDPVKMLNVYGAGLCDDSGYVGCSLLYHAGLNAAKYGKNPSVRTLHGHMMCEAYLDGSRRFLDIDENTFYLDLENERMVGGDAIVADHYLARREHAYGPIFHGWRIGDDAASLFGRDDGSTFRAAAGHRIEFDLRPGERIIYRWDNCGKFASDDRQTKRGRRFWGNSLWVYEPVLTEQRVQADAVEATAGRLVYAMKTPYTVCGGRLVAEFSGGGDGKRPAVSLSLDGKKWKPLWTAPGGNAARCKLDLDDALQYKKGPAKYVYLLKIDAVRSSIRSLRIETDLMTSPHALPRLDLGCNKVEYTDETPAPHEITITHRWRESSAVTPPAPPAAPLAPADGATVQAATVAFRWPAASDAARYHFQVSRRSDMRFAYRPCFDVVIDRPSHHSPFAGLFNPGEPYYWRVRPCNRHGVWGAWSPVWRFRWRGPRVPRNVRPAVQGREITLSWEPDPRGERPARYEVYGSDEKGFVPSKTAHEVKGLGRQPANLLGVTEERTMRIVGAGISQPAANRAFYRVVAVDAAGTPSGPSALVELPHPFLYSRPATAATAGKEYRYRLRTLRSLGDLQHRYTAPGAAFWEREEYEFAMTGGPSWLHLDARTAELRGTPGAKDRGTHRVTVVCRRRFPHEVKKGSSKSASFLKDAPRFQAEDRQSFELRVEPARQSAPPAPGDRG